MKGKKERQIQRDSQMESRKKGGKKGKNRSNYLGATGTDCFCVSFKVDELFDTSYKKNRVSALAQSPSGEHLAIAYE